MDVKPANILWIDRWVLGDFGMSTYLLSTGAEEGDCTTMAPELLLQGSLCTKADVFSLGLTVWTAVTGQLLPKNGPEWLRLRSKDVDRDARVQFLAALGPLAELVADMLDPKPGNAARSA
jgi:mitosis inhibitor protein kinase SWE1